MDYTALIEPDELAAALMARRDASDCVVVDCRFDLADVQAGRRAYRQAHLPGARYADLDADLSRAPQPADGRHPLPEPSELAERFGAWGIGDATQVVVYDDVGGASAGRLWWLLRWLGHARVAVLNGGLPAWVAAGHALTAEVSPPMPQTFTPRPDAAAVVDVDTLRDELQRGACLLVDVRAAARFRGEHEPIDPVAGHVPGAVNRPFAENLDPTGRFLSPEQLAESLRELCSEFPPDRVVAMCGSGVTACHLLLAMAHAGWPVGRLYPGSWSEWIRDPQRPVEIAD
ncbi:sulfurtransferase [Acidihalobacter ferrooxydans]|uniref:Sulfurtransferase n=2 Tax=Acidihalobacter ferrooxydans TaxID=1765967 RepID=A0A1P8ULM9_9GAMM|nr:sulfurtransferase [Acidihalobacter ferrooxydans]